MSTLNLPSNVKYDSNTGAYVITNAQGKTLRVAAGTQDQLDAYVNSVNTGAPITVTTTSPSTGNPVTREFNPTAIYNAQEDSGSRLAAMTAVKRQTGIIGNADGSYYDLRTSQTITREQAEAKVAAAGLPPESLNLVTPRSSPAYNEAQASLDNTVNLPSNLGGTAAPLNPVQSPAGPGTGAVVTQSVPPYTTTGVASTVTPTPTANAASPLRADGDEALAAAQAAQEVRDLQIAAGSSTPVDIQTDGLLEQQQAILQAQEAAELQIAAESSTPVDPYTEGLLLEQEQLRQFQAEEALNARLDRAAELDLANSGDAALEAADRAREAADLQTAALTYSPEPVSTLTAVNPEEFGATNVVQNQADIDANNAVARGATNARKQNTLQTRVNQPAAADWRVRLSLAPNSTYLYNARPPGILAPLAATDGVIFPYTPSIETSYQAKYDSYDLTHSNYRGYFYKNSFVENISIKGTFTAQDTREAQYLLAVIHFFRSVTKMFYGQDAEAGTPPPLVYLNGFGKYQFNDHPCVVANFGYSLPNDIDYIRADGFNNIGLNMENRRSQSSGPGPGGSLGTVVAIIDRLSNAGLKNGSLSNRPSPGQVTQNVTNQSSVNSTYVPTKIEISLTLYPMQTRNQVSKQFSLKEFANGSLLEGGFW